MPVSPIPGSGVLGWGFNIFGTYSQDSKTRQLFLFPNTGKQQTIDGTTYAVPDNIGVDTSVAGSFGDSRVFEDRREVESYFSAQAGMTVKIGEPGFKFKGQFDAMYSQASQSDTSYLYGMLISAHRSWSLAVLDQSTGALAPWVQDDPDFAGLPATFNDANAPAFFRFFDKYGTHYASGVTVGWKLYFNEAVQRSYTQSKETVQAKMSLEFKAFFLDDSKASADATWTESGHDYSESRTASVVTEGGSSVILDAVVPTYGSNRPDLFDLWRQSADQSPVAFDFTLSPISGLFSGAQAAAVEEAYAAYGNSHLYAEAKTFSSLLQVKGRIELPVEPRPSVGSAAGFQATVLKRSDLSVVTNRFFSFPVLNYWDKWPALYEQMYGFLRNFNQDHIVALASFGMQADWFPTDNFYQFLVSCGAGSGLAQWERTMAPQGSAARRAINYILVGIPQGGTGTGMEAFTVSSSVQVILNGTIQYDGAPTATLLAQLRYSARAGQWSSALLEPPAIHLAA